MASGKMKHMCVDVDTFIHIRNLRLGVVRRLGVMCDYQ